MFKRCPKCGEIKLKEAFAKCRTQSDGLQAYCRVCRAVQTKAWAAANKRRMKTLRADWHTRNKERRNADARVHSYFNRPQYTAKQAKRRASVLQATPPWANLDAIKLIYEEARRLGLDVDHAIPLQSEIVCGLHVEHNLQLLSSEDNRAKGNSFVF